jgi:hypothetical protein
MGDRLHTLVGDDIGELSSYGETVAVHDGVAFVGAPSFTSSPLPGSVYLFDTTTGQQFRKLQASEPRSGDIFGASISTDGGKAAIGSWIWNAEPIHIVDMAGDLLTQRGTWPNNPGGSSIAIDGDALIVATRPPLGTSAGPVAVALNVLDEQSVVPVSLDNGQPGDAGGRVAIDKGVGLVGVVRSSYPVYAFDVMTGEVTHELLPASAIKTFNYGSALAIEGGLALVGDRGRQSAYLFDVATGNQLAVLQPEELTTGGGFGWSAAIHNGIAVIGASNAAYLFDLATGEQLARLTPGPEQPPGPFGTTVGIHNGIAIVGGGTVQLFDATRPSLAGDFNNNGVVDAADYTVWRDGLGETYLESGRLVWERAYGNSAMEHGPSVPEPHAFLLFLAASAPLFSRRR